MYTEINGGNNKEKQLKKVILINFNNFPNVHFEEITDSVTMRIEEHYEYIILIK